MRRGAMREEYTRRERDAESPLAIVKTRHLALPQQRPKSGHSMERRDYVKLEANVRAGHTIMDGTREMGAARQRKSPRTQCDANGRR